MVLKSSYSKSLENLLHWKLSTFEAWYIVSARALLFYPHNYFKFFDGVMVYIMYLSCFCLPSPRPWTPSWQAPLLPSYLSGFCDPLSFSRLAYMGTRRGLVIGTGATYQCQHLWRIWSHPYPQPLMLGIPQGMGGLREPLPHLQWNIDKPEESLFIFPPQRSHLIPLLSL